MPISDFLQQLFSQSVAGNPDYDQMPGYDRNQVGRLALQKLVGSLQTGTTAFGGLYNGITGGQNLYSDELDKWTAEEAKKKQQEATLLSTQQNTTNAAQENDLRTKQEARTSESFPLEQKKRTQDLQFSTNTDQRETDRNARETLDEQRKQEQYDRATTGAKTAQMLGRNPQEKAVLGALAQAGQYDVMWKQLAEIYLPQPWHKDGQGPSSWSDPYLKPGVGLVQRNERSNSIRILARDPNEDASRFKASPIAFNKLKMQILEQRLIPEYLKNAPSPGVGDRVSAFLNTVSGGHIGSPPPGPSEPMMEFGGNQIPASLMKKAEDIASREYVGAYKSAVSEFRGNPPPSKYSAPQSVGSAPIKGKPIQDFSSRLALEKAIRSSVASSPQYAPMDQGTKEQYITQQIDDIMGQVGSGQTTLEQAIKAINSQAISPGQTYPTPQGGLQPVPGQDGDQ